MFWIWEHQIFSIFFAQSNFQNTIIISKLLLKHEKKLIFQKKNNQNRLFEMKPCPFIPFLKDAKVQVQIRLLRLKLFCEKLYFVDIHRSNLPRELDRNSWDEKKHKRLRWVIVLPSKSSTRNKNCFLRHSSKRGS